MGTLEKRTIERLLSWRCCSVDHHDDDDDDDGDDDDV
jgi:hypothetical protein